MSERNLQLLIGLRPIVGWTSRGYENGENQEGLSLTAPDARDKKEGGTIEYWSARGEGCKIFKHGETPQAFMDATPLAGLTPFAPKV